MRSYIAIFAGALIVGVLMTPVMRWVGLKVRAVSGTGGRHVHERVIPRLGGVALAAGWSIPLLVMFQTDEFAMASLDGSNKQLFGVIFGGLVLCAVGAVDDIKGVKASHKLITQVATAILAYVCGFRIEAIALPFGGAMSMGAFALPVTVIWIVGITNALNLIDGLDGLAAGIGFFAALTSFVLAYLSGSVFVALLMAALMGVLLGFLFFNFNPARIFMGDSGSYFLGYVLATMSLAGSLQQKASTAVSLLVPVIALGLPIFDTLFSMVRRFLERRPIFSPDRGHIHHRLLDLGLTHRRAVIVLYAVSVVLAASAIAVSLGRSWEVGVAMLSTSIVFVGLVRFGGYVEYLHVVRRQKSRIYEPRVEQLRQTIPTLLERLQRSRTEADVFGLLEFVQRHLRFDLVHVFSADFERRWEGGRPGEANVLNRDLVIVTYPLGRDDHARAKVRFGWKSTEQHVAPHADILLQLLADGVARALHRAGSALSPEEVVRAESEVLNGIPAASSP